MIHRKRYPGSGTVACFTNIGGADMRRTFTGGGQAVVARRTSTQHIVMIHSQGRNPGIGGMTGVANVGRRDVSHRQGMTATAGTQHLGVIHGYRRHPQSGCMAGLANLGGGDMGQTFTRCGNTIVTIVAYPYHLGMIHHDRHPGSGGMAGRTFVGRTNMRIALAGGYIAIVAAKTICRGQLRMIHCNGRCPG